MEETVRCSKIPNHSTDWKLNPNVKCRIILDKFKIKTPEHETIEFCRTLKNLSVPMEPPLAVPTTTDMHFKSEFVLDILLNEILGKCVEKCKVCEEYVQQLRHHIIQTHSGHPNPSPHTQTVTVFKCDVCSSIYSSPSMLIRHRNTHSNFPNQSDSLTTQCTDEHEPVQINSNNIYSSFDISSVTKTNESVSSGQCEDHPHQPVLVPPMYYEWNFLKQEPSESHSQVEISNPNSLGVLQHMNHLSTIENNLKQECNDLEWEEDLQEPLLLQDMDIHVPSSVKYECTEMSIESEQQTVLDTHAKSSKDMPTGTGRFPVPSDLDLDLITHNIAQSVPKPHKCDRCGDCFRTLQHLTQHKLTHTGAKPHECNQCGKCFGQRFSLTRHKLIHSGERPHKCDECGKSFTLNSQLTQHKLTHTGERPFRCEGCGKDFALNSNLTKHKSIHTREGSFGCDECGKCFSIRINLKKHKLIHTGEKSHKCDVCGKCFGQRFILTRHKRTHTGEQPHKCDVCGQSFKGRGHLAQHKLTHTGETSSRCDVCGERFDGRDELTQHKLSHILGKVPPRHLSTI